MILLKITKKLQILKLLNLKKNKIVQQKRLLSFKVNILIV
jgi:hypothetical protein